jgi:hypothetical protein
MFNAEGTTWLITNPAHQNTYSKYEAPQHGPLLTKPIGVGAGWHEYPDPIPCHDGQARLPPLMHPPVSTLPHNPLCQNPMCCLFPSV